MTTSNFELFEYNKMMLTYGLTTLIVAAWITKMAVSGKFIFKRSAFEIPLVLFLLSQFLSFLFSIDRHASFWGYYSRFHGGLLSTISYLLLYFALVSNLKRKEILSSLRWLLLSAVLVTLYGVLEHFGIDAKSWVQDVQNRVFSTLGQPNWLAAYLSVLIPLPLALALQHKRNIPFLLLYFLAFLLFTLCLIFTKSRSGILAATISLVLFLAITLLPKLSASTKKYKIAAGAFLLVLLLGSGLVFGKYLNRLPNLYEDSLYIFGQTDKTIITVQKHAQGGSPSSEIRKIVWRGAYDIFRANPVWGSGVETFAYSYYQYRPKEHNLISEWDFLYNKAHNEYFNFLATTGAFGLGSYLLFIVWLIVWSTRKLFSLNHQPSIINHKLFVSLFAGWLSILITNFFGFSVVPVAIFFFLIPAFLWVLNQPEENKEAQPVKSVLGWKKQPINHVKKGAGMSIYTILCVTWIIAGYFIIRLVNMWAADMKYADGVRLGRQGEYALAHESLKEAINLNSDEPNYYDELAWNASNLAYLYKSQKDDINTPAMINLALSSSDKALSISPKHLNFYRTRAKVYFKLINIDQSYLQKALSTLLVAGKLAPTEAKISYNTALVYQALGQRQEAIKTLEKTVGMKNNYFEARTALAQLYKENNQVKEALGQEEYILKYINPQSGDAQKKIEDWNKLL